MEPTYQKIDDDTFKVITPLPPSEETVSLSTLSLEKDNLNRQIDDVKRRAEEEVQGRTARIAEIDALIAAAGAL